MAERAFVTPVPDGVWVYLKRGSATALSYANRAISEVVNKVGIWSIGQK
jgi:hypothetical protein